MNAIVSWATTMTPPLAFLKGKWAGLFLLAFVLLGLAVVGFMGHAKTAPSPTLLAERGEASPTLAHYPEPESLQGSITLSQPLPTTTAIPVATAATPDPLLLKHSQKLADLDTVVTQVRGDMAGMASRLDGFQAELHGIKQQLAQRPAYTKTIITRHQGNVDAGKVRPHRQRAKGNRHAASSPKAHSAPDLQLVAVNNWGSESRIIVREKDSNQYRQLRMGDALYDGTIVGMNARHITLKNANGIATVDLAKGKP